MFSDNLTQASSLSLNKGNQIQVNKNSLFNSTHTLHLLRSKSRNKQPPISGTNQSKAITDNPHQHLVKSNLSRAIKNRPQLYLEGNNQLILEDLEGSNQLLLESNNKNKTTDTLKKIIEIKRGWMTQECNWQNNLTNKMINMMKKLMRILTINLMTQMTINTVINLKMTMEMRNIIHSKTTVSKIINSSEDFKMEMRNFEHIKI